MAGTYKTVLNKNKFSRITAIAIGVLVSIPLLLFGWFSLQGTFTRASDDEPRDVVITNITSTSARVEWTTGQSTQGVVEYGTSEEALVFFAPETQQGTTHGVDLTLLTPATTHYFQIKIGDKVFTNNGTGKPWQFTTRTKDGQVVEPEPIAIETIVPATPSAAATEIPIATLIPATPSPSIKITGISLPSATPTKVIANTSTPTSGSLPTSLPTSSVLSCNETDCEKIKQKLGLGCTATDYIKCMNKNGVTIIPTTTKTPTPSLSPTVTPTSKPAITADECKLTDLRYNNCRSWFWSSMDTKPQACRNAFYRYVLRCKNNSFIPTPGVNNPDIWYFDGAITNIASPAANIPAFYLPTPAPNSMVYCEVRAEDQIGGDSNATPWVYNSVRCM